MLVRYVRQDAESRGSCRCSFESTEQEETAFRRDRDPWEYLLDHAAVILRRKMPAWCTAWSSPLGGALRLGRLSREEAETEAAAEFTDTSPRVAAGSPRSRCRPS